MIKVSALIFACIFVVSFADSTEPAAINIWHKISTDELNPGEIIPLDMSKGYISCEGPYIVMVVRIVDSEEEVIIMFPNGGYWTAPKPDPFLKELQHEFDSLEDYLRNLEGKEIKKK